MSEVVIESLSHDGRGIARIEGKCCFVEDALPGERVTIQIYHQKRTFSEAKVLERLVDSTERETPACPHFGVCGGCSLQHIAQSKQIELKQSVMLEQLEHFGGVKPFEILPPIFANPYGYRRKARLGLRYVHKKEKLLMGFREKKGRYLADCETCAVIHPNIQAIWQPIKDCVQSLSIYVDIPQIELAVGDEETVLVIRHLNPFTEEDLAKLAQFGEAHQLHLYLQPKGPDTVHKIYPADGQVKLTCRLDAFNLTYHAHPLDFLQVNRSVNEQMIVRALELLDVKSTDTVFDAFCGLGNFTLPLAQRAKHVTGVEGEQSMVERVKHNAQFNNILNVDAHAQDLFTDFSAQAWVKAYDKMLIDPPRSGAEALCQQIHHFNPKKIVYVSCNPSTLARDAGILKSKGYRLAKAGVMDMFTHTHHTEAMALFTK